MENILPKEYLKYALSHRGELVLQYANVDVCKKEGNYYIRTVFPVQIFSRRKKPCDLPYLRYSTFLYVVAAHRVEIYTEELYKKIKKRLCEETALQIAIARIVCSEILSEKYGIEHKRIRSVIIDAIKRENAGLRVFKEYAIQKIEFNYYTEKTTALTPNADSCLTLTKTLLRKMSRELYYLQAKVFLDAGKEKGQSQHKGWMSEGIYPFYCGIEDLGKKGTEIPPEPGSGKCPVSMKEIERIFSLVPYTVSIPLFSFVVFSILKYFYPKYPSRISVNDAYKTVKGKINKILYLALAGKNESLTEEIAELYCGSFLRHSIRGTPARRDELKYVHDGIAIYVVDAKRRLTAAEKGSKKKLRLKVTEKNLGQYIIKDACGLFVNADFPLSAAPIRVLLDQGGDKYPQTISVEDRDKIDVLLDSFIKWCEEFWPKQLENNDNLMEWSADRKNRETANALMASFTKEQLTAMLAKAEQELEDISGNHMIKRKCAYLLSAYRIFITYLRNSCAADDNYVVDNLNCVGIKAIQDLCRDQRQPNSVEQAFSKYISRLFETSAIILIRSEPKGRVSGWFDPKRNAVLLPYASYYEEFLDFCGRGGFVYSKAEFQKEILAPAGFIELKKNGKSNYYRADVDVVVSPIGAENAPKEKMIRINLEPFQKLAPLSKKAVEKIRRLSSQPVKRRAPNKGQASD